MPARDNPESWIALLEFVAEFPDNSTWSDWKLVATEFIQRGIACGLHRRFRAGQSMHTLIFSTLEHHGLGDEPRVSVVIRSREEIQISYLTTFVFTRCSSRDVVYQLPFEDAFATFRRFLLQLWTATVPEPIPDDIRSPDAPFTAPILT
jgi:hypothetical protein